MCGEEREVGGHGEEAEGVGEGWGEEEDLLLTIISKVVLGWCVCSTYVDVELPVEPPVDVQSVLELPTRQQTLRQHRGQKHGQCIVIAESRHLDAHLKPPILALPSPVLILAVHSHVLLVLLLLAQHWALRCLLDFGLDPNKRLGPVFERNARAAICIGEDIVFGAHGAEVARPFGDIEAQRKILTERGAQEGEFGRREIDEGGLGRHAGVLCVAVGVG